jgi:hypothetical protein
MPVHNRILLPSEIAPGHVWVPSLGLCDVETLPGGWLIRLVDDDAVCAATRVTLDLRDSAAPLLGMVGQFGEWRHDISLRFAEILLILALGRGGRSALELADDLYGDRSRVGAVRVEMSRLRKQFTGIVAARPYRFADAVHVDVSFPEDGSDVLAPSVAPVVRAIRASRCVQAAGE